MAIDAGFIERLTANPEMTMKSWTVWFRSEGKVYEARMRRVEPISWQRVEIEFARFCGFSNVQV